MAWYIKDAKRRPILEERSLAFLAASIQERSHGSFGQVAPVYEKRWSFEAIKMCQDQCAPTYCNFSAKSATDDRNSIVSLSRNAIPGSSRWTISTVVNCESWLSNSRPWFPNARW